ncbi:SOS response-associated peptidase [Corynebacterium flavescens]|uniref:SOS response-associated peptidase n=1 Tax=Corynebacterium flavescens TaxID=28028 RepID=UPI003FD13F84
MCGRFILFTESLLAEVGNLPGVGEVHAPQGIPGPRFNIAPTQVVPAVRLREELAQVDPARWGLLPGWKKDESGPPLFNARAETVRSKPSFRAAFKAQRCLIPMNGYYEWHDDGAGKAPYYVTRGEGLLWAAGLWEEGLERLSATIVTTAATPEMEWLHDRLPRFLGEEEVRTWATGSPEEAASLLAPTGLEDFSARKADKAVGNVSNDYPALIGTFGV